MLGRRVKYRVNITTLDAAIKDARALYNSGDYLRSLDVYEQITDLLDPNSPDQADVLTAILAEVFDRVQPFFDLDRYTLYQSRYFDFSIEKSHKILDIGSGDRPFPLATHLADIALADGNVGRAGMPLKFVEGKPLFECSIEKLPFDDKEFDFVYCSHVLEHANDPEKACRELMRVGKRGFIETPTRGKDLWLNYAKISNHRWGVELYNDVLFFAEYNPYEVSGFNCSILNLMHASPQTVREKAFSALIILKADLVNNMLLWDGEFRFEVRRTRDALPAKEPEPSPAPVAGRASEVAVVMPSYNRARLLPRAIGSIQKQTRRVSEIIIVDDASTDNTREVVQDLRRHDPRIRYIRHEKNSGAQAARNTGIRHATTEWIAFLDSDDEWLPHKIEQQLLYADQSGLSIVHSECLLADEQLGTTRRFGVTPCTGNVYSTLLTNPGPMFQGMLVRRKCLLAIGLVDEDVPSYQEWETSIRLARYYEFGFIPEPLFVYHYHSGETISKDSLREAEGWAYVVEKHAPEIVAVAGLKALLCHYGTLVDKFAACNDYEKSRQYELKIQRSLGGQGSALAVSDHDRNVTEDIFGIITALTDNDSQKALLRLTASLAAHPEDSRLHKAAGFLRSPQTGSSGSMLVDPAMNRSLQYWLSSHHQRQTCYDETKRNSYELKERFVEAGVPVKEVKINCVAFEEWLRQFSKLFNSYGGNEVSIEKCLEHYLSFTWLALSSQDVYIDVASEKSIWGELLVERGYNAYKMDLIFPPGINGRIIGANAADTGLPAGSVNAMSLQCAFETFQNDTDINFIREANRILAPGGRLAIVPLYTNENHFIMSSPEADLSAHRLDRGALRVWREDGWTEPFSRHYSPEAFAQRIYSQLGELRGQVMYVSNLSEVRERYTPQRIYCDFMFFAAKSPAR